MGKLNMRLGKVDEDNLRTLKKFYGLSSNAQVVRFLLKSEAEKHHTEKITFDVKKLKEVLNSESDDAVTGTIEHDTKQIRAVYFTSK